MLFTRVIMSSASATATMAATPSTMKLGLERILPLLDRLGSPQAKWPVIHIAGTNSKGTTSSILDSLVTSTGILTARFNSPHLRYPRDSCRIAGSVVGQDVWTAAHQKVQEANTTSSAEATPFELLFAQFLAACQLDGRPQLLIVECGMGGATDATNVFPAANVLASVITPVGGDHKAVLGPTIADIAQHKMGIAKERGLVVVADQRPRALRPQAQQQQQRSRLSRWTADDEDEAIFGQDSASVMSTIRRMAETRKARLVRCEEQTSPTASLVQHGPWELRQASRCLLSPILQLPPSETDEETGISSIDDLASTLYTNAAYTALAGQRPMTTPSLPPLPPTPAVASAVCTALNTLFAVASDEPWSARQMDNSDPHEDVRLQLAWAVRESGLLSGEHGALSHEWSSAIVRGVEGWEGRGSWCDVPTSSQPLHVFVDGAHNLPALSALFDHLASLIAHRYTGTAQKRKLTATLLFSFSSSKANDGDLEQILALLAQAPALLSRPRGDDASLSQTFERSVSLVPQTAADISVRIGFVNFSTPVEGMPWVQPQSASELAGALQGKEGLREVESFDSIQTALEWAASAGDGRPAAAGEIAQEDSLIVFSGSLYLVGDLYRHMDATSGGAHAVASQTMEAAPEAIEDATMT